MQYKVILTEDAANDFRALDKSIKVQVAKQLKKLEYSPYLGEHLGRKGPFNLTGYYKLYAVKKSIRIIYRIIEKKIIVEVVAIGKRENIEVYKEAFKRILKYHKRERSVFFNKL